MILFKDRETGSILFEILNKVKQRRRWLCSVNITIFFLSFYRIEKKYTHNLLLRFKEPIYKNISIKFELLWYLNKRCLIKTKQDTTPTKKKTQFLYRYQFICITRWEGHVSMMIMKGHKRIKPFLSLRNVTFVLYKCVASHLRLGHSKKVNNRRHHHHHHHHQHMPKWENDILHQANYLNCKTEVKLLCVCAHGASQ